MNLTFEIGEGLEFKFSCDALPVTVPAAPQIPVTSASAIAKMLTGRMVTGTATTTETEV